MRKTGLLLMCLLGGLFGLSGQSKFEETYVPPLEEPNLRYADGIFQQMVEADLFIRSGRYEEAILMLDNLIHQYPNIPEVYIKRGMVKYVTGRTTEAREDFRIADRLNPYAGDLYGHLGKNRRLNVMALDFPIDGFVDASPWEGQEEQMPLSESARREMKAGNWLAALPDLNAAVELTQEQEPIALKMRGDLNLLLDRHLGAINDYTKAIQLSPETPALYYNRGLAKLLIYDRSGACWDFEKSASLGYDRSLEKLKYFCSF